MRMRLNPLPLIAPAGLLIVLPFVASLLVLAGYSLRDPSGGFGFGGWAEFLSDPFHWRVIAETLILSAVVTVTTLVIAYPTAVALTRLSNPVVIVGAYVVLFAPFLMSVIVRSYGWLLLLSDRGMVNASLAQLGLGPYRLIHNEIGVVIALVHVMLPFAVLPLVSLLSQLPASYREAAFDLGASSGAVFWRVTLPLTRPALIAACEIVFALTMSSFVTPSVLGGGRVLVLSRLVYDNIGNLEWALASVQACTLLILTLLVLAACRKLGQATRYAQEEA